MSNKLLNSFASTCFGKLYLQSDSADIHFVFSNGEEVPAHKLLLASASPVFKAMFNGIWNQNETVNITDSNASAFKEFLQFIYLPEVTLKIENIEEVVRLADYYDMLDCFKTCAEYLQSNLTTENMIWGYQLAITLKNEWLMEFCEKRIQICCVEIIKSEMFLHCSRDVIDHILKLNALDCDEAELFNACIEWAKVSCQKNGLDEGNSENLKTELGACFYLFRFGAMDDDEIDKIIQNMVVYGMFTKNELADIMRSKSSKGPKLELFNHQPRLKPSYKWNTANKLVCYRHILTDQTRYAIQDPESTWFSTNEFILLGEMVLFPIVKGRSDSDKLSFDIKIIEHDENNFATDAPTKQLYTKNDVQNRSTLVFDTPILIRPNKMYEIRSHLKNFILFFFQNLSYNVSWGNSEFRLNDKITIKFHQNPSEINSERRGLVSSLSFNRI